MAGRPDAGPRPAPASILVVEDDRKTAELVALYLRHAGHRVAVEHSGDRGLARALREEFDLLVLDVMLPGADGLRILREARAVRPVPVILLTARTREEERVGGLESGADDYVPKPFSPRELVARVHAVLRRVPPGEAGRRVHGPLVVDLDRRRVTVDGREVSLTPAEYALLACLVERPGFARSRAHLLEVLPGNPAERLDRTVDAHVRNLRCKIEADPSEPRLIETVTGVGYRLADAFPP